MVDSWRIHGRLLFGLGFVAEWRICGGFEADLRFQRSDVSENSSKMAVDWSISNDIFYCSDLV